MRWCEYGVATALGGSPRPDLGGGTSSRQAGGAGQLEGQEMGLLCPRSFAIARAATEVKDDVGNSRA